MAFYKDNKCNFESLTLNYWPQKIDDFTKLENMKADIVVKHTLREDKGYVDELVEIMRNTKDHGLYLCNNMIDWDYDDLDYDEMQERYESFQMKPIINWINDNYSSLSVRNGFLFHSIVQQVIS